VREHAPSDEFRDIARLRLAAIALDENAPDEALKLLDAKHGAAYESQYAAMRGDALLAKNQRADARAAYQLALEKAVTEQSAFRESVRMRLEALGS
jgi:predicted negative regulator of RcsB-dependent stress response